MSFSRRAILKSAAAGAGALALARLSFGQTTAAASDEKLILSAPLTHADWTLKPNIAWGPEGVHHMLDACKACGWSRVHWRVLDGGRALYASKFVRPEFKMEADNIWDPQTDEEKTLYKKFFGSIPEARRIEILTKQQRYDYGTFDTLDEAVRYGHQIGLQIHAWVSINEDDHGWGLASDFAKAHPQFAWVKRDGKNYHSQMSFAFPEVREYKLAIVNELLANYDIDGLFLDWIRTGDIRDNPQTDEHGVANSGYEAPNVEAFKQRFGVDPHDVPSDDPRWVKLRCEPQTIFMRQVRERVNRDPRRRPVCAMVGHPWHYRGMIDKIDGNPRGLLLDVATWADEGLIDSVIAAGYYRDGGDATKAFAALREETKNKVDVWYYGWVPNSVAEFERDFKAARDLGAKQILFWEADYIDDRANAGELKAAMSKRAKS